MILTDLAELNALLAAHLTSNKVKMLATGDILTGIKNATSGQLMDSMYSSWNTDPVHGEKVAYTRIDLGLLDIVRKEPPSPPPPHQGGGEQLQQEEGTRGEPRPPEWIRRPCGRPCIKPQLQQLQEG
jgi:hypothetical protein